MMSRQSGWLFGALVALQVEPAQAQRSLPELSWQAPAGCPQAPSMREKLRSLAGTAKARAGNLRAEGEITRLVDGRFQLRLVVREGELVGERIIASDSCEDLAGAAAVTLGLLMSSETPLNEQQLGVDGAATTAAGNDTEATAGAGGATNDQAPQGAASAPPPPEPVEPRDASPNSTATRRWRAFVRVPAAAMELGPLPEPSFGLGLGLGARHGSWRLLASGTLWQDQVVSGREQPAHGARVEHLAAALAVGHAFRVERFELAPFASVSLEHFSARGSGAGVTPRESSVRFASVGLGLSGALPLGEVAALVAEVSGRVETARPVIAIEGLGDVRQLGAAALTSTLAAEWTF